MWYTDNVAYWIERAKALNYEIDYSKLDQSTVNSLIYAASHLFSELEKAAQTSNKGEQ